MCPAEHLRILPVPTDQVRGSEKWNVILFKSFTESAGIMIN